MNSKDELYGTDDDGLLIDPLGNSASAGDLVANLDDRPDKCAFIV